MWAMSVQIENFRRFETFACSLNPAFTLLMGPNGSGKTSLLKAIHLVLGLVRQSIGGPPQGIGDTDVRCTDAVDPFGARWRTPVLPVSLKLVLALDERERIDLVRSRTASAGDDSRLDTSKIARVAGAWFEPDHRGPIPVIARFGATPPTGSPTPGQVHKPFDNKRQVWQLAEVGAPNVGNLAQWFQYNELRKPQEGQEPLVYAQVRTAVLSAIHAIDIRYIVRDNALMVMHGTQGWRPFDQLSDGQLRIAALVCDLAIRCATLNSHLGDDCIAETPGIVTIDELDLHLHPIWQRQIVADLRKMFAKAQFIATSHSPFLLQAALEHGQVVDMRSGDFVEPTDRSIEDIAESVMDVDQPQRGQRFLAMKAAAQRYYELLEEPTRDVEGERRLRDELDASLSVFANDPASAAWLAQRRIAAGR